MSILRNGWLEASLSDLCSRIVDGSHNPPKAVNSGFPMLSARNIESRSIKFNEFRFINEVDFALENARTNIKAGDVLLTIVGTIGRVAVVPVGVEHFALQRSVAVLKPLIVDSRYLAYSIESPAIQEYLFNNATGTAQKGVYLRTLSQVMIPLAPLSEQKRIADKLDALLARVDACRNRLDRVSSILDRFRQSVLSLAMSGELTAEWREISHESTEWQNVMLSEICSSIVDGTHQAPPQTESGIPFITIAAINDGHLHIEKATRFVSSLYFEQLQPSRKPVIGDILFSVTGSIAIPALVDVNEPFIFQRHIAILKPNSSRIVSKFLFYALSSENIKRQSQFVATGTAQKTISISRLRAFEIDIPSIEEQIEVVRRIESLFAYVDLIEDKHRRACIQVEQLTPTLLNMAFRGELVSQDPADEPASVLLERILIEKAAQTIEPRVSTTRRSSMIKFSQESVKEVINQLPNDKFSFEELRGEIPGNYDLLKDIFFTLLDETDPIVEQVFDREAKSMYFVRGSK